MNKGKQIKKNLRVHQAAPDDLVEQITLDADGDGEQLWAFRQAFEDDLEVPCAAFVLGIR